MASYSNVSAFFKPCPIRTTGSSRFDSFEDLVDKLERADLAEIHERMEQYTQHVAAYVENTWTEVP